jgi:hypothetical protein
VSACFELGPQLFVPPETISMVAAQFHPALLALAQSLIHLQLRQNPRSL